MDRKADISVQGRSGLTTGQCQQKQRKNTIKVISKAEPI